MFDSHCHLQDKRVAGCVDGVVAEAVGAGVRRMLCCGSEPDDWADVARIGIDHPSIITCAFGIHPWYVDRVSGHGWELTLEDRLKADPAAAVGEIGLDNVVNPRNDCRQAEVFTRQLEIARKYRRPVSIHCRKAWGSLLSILRDMGGLADGGAIHSYSGSPDVVPELEKLGCYISFSGSVLNGRNRRAAESLRKVSPYRLLIETDSPDILPHGVEGPYNVPANLPVILRGAAEILGRPADDVSALTHENGERLFNLSFPTSS